MALNPVESIGAQLLKQSKQELIDEFDKGKAQLVRELKKVQWIMAGFLALNAVAFAVVLFSG